MFISSVTEPSGRVKDILLVLLINFCFYYLIFVFTFFLFNMLSLSCVFLTLSTDEEFGVSLVGSVGEKELAVEGTPYKEFWGKLM